MTQTLATYELIDQIPMNTIQASTKAKSQVAHPRNRLLLWARRVLLSLFVTLVAIGAIGATYQAIGAQADKRNYPPPGQLYDIGGYRLHLYCTGQQDTGDPTVILETLAGGTSANWAWIQPEIAKVTHVCSYDRAGRGWSEATPGPQTLQQTVKDLHTLLQKAEVIGPFVLVGHSIGGIYMRRFASEYPDETVGIVLIDSSHPDQFVRIPQLQAGLEYEARTTAIYPTLARLGLWRLYFASGGEIDFAGLPARQHDEVAAFWSSPKFFASSHAEVAAQPAIFSEAHTLGNLDNLPLAVISRGNEPAADWIELQRELAALSSNSIQITVAGATHTSLALNEKHAGETSQAILRVVKAARTGELLSLK